MDDFMTTIIFYDGQFWIAIIEKSEQGNLFIGKYVFGTEPTGPELIGWMRDTFANVPLFPTDHFPVFHHKKARRETTKNLINAKTRFSETLSAYLRTNRHERECRKEETYAQKVKKKKAKRNH